MDKSSAYCAIAGGFSFISKLVMHRGYVKMWRSCQDNEMYFSEKFTRWQARQDLILLANHKKGSFIKRGNLVVVNRGQLAKSESTLAKRWMRSRNKVRRYLNYLETIQQIEQQKSHIVSIITIKNYNKYQGNDTTDDTTDDTTYKNDKNVKEENNIYRAFKHLKISEQEVQKLKDLGYTSEQIDDTLNRIENYKKNKNYVSLYLTCLNRLKKAHPVKQVAKSMSAIEAEREAERKALATKTK